MEGTGPQLFRENKIYLYIKRLIILLPYILIYSGFYYLLIAKAQYRQFVYQSIYAHTEKVGAGREVIELNVQPDHVHLLAKAPPKILISE